MERDCQTIPTISDNGFWRQLGQPGRTLSRCRADNSARREVANGMREGSVLDIPGSATGLRWCRTACGMPFRRKRCRDRTMRIRPRSCDPRTPDWPWPVPDSAGNQFPDLPRRFFRKARDKADEYRGIKAVQHRGRPFLRRCFCGWRPCRAARRRSCGRSGGPRRSRARSFPVHSGPSGGREKREAAQPAFHATSRRRASRSRSARNALPSRS